jgi:hypothetical protein
MVIGMPNALSSLVELGEVATPVTRAMLKAGWERENV